jgi:hypothetical protein
MMIGNGSEIAEFSRQNCVAICVFLVPANLIITTQTLIFSFLGYSRFSTRLTACFAFIYAIAIISHVISWFLVGIVMAPTFILLGLGFVCLATNLLAIAQKERFSNLLRIGLRNLLRYLSKRFAIEIPRLSSQVSQQDS